MTLKYTSTCSSAFPKPDKVGKSKHLPLSLYSFLLEFPSTLHLPLITDSFSSHQLNYFCVLHAGNKKPNKFQALLSRNSPFSGETGRQKVPQGQRVSTRIEEEQEYLLLCGMRRQAPGSFAKWQGQLDGGERSISVGTYAKTCKVRTSEGVTLRHLPHNILELRLQICLLTSQY